MSDYGEQTIQFLGARSFGVVMGVTIFFALLGAGLVIFMGGSAIWGAWIPFCFLVIPPVHYLGRELLRQRQQITELEKRLNER